MRRRRTPETIVGRLNSDGTPLAGEGFFSQRISAGVYRINLPQGFKVLSAAANCAGGYCVITNYTPNSFDISTGTVTTPSNPIDTMISFVIGGIQQ